MPAGRETAPPARTDRTLAPTPASSGERHATERHWSRRVGTTDDTPGPRAVQIASGRRHGVR